MIPVSQDTAMTHTVNVGGGAKTTFLWLIWNVDIARFIVAMEDNFDKFLVHFDSLVVSGYETGIGC